MSEKITVRHLTFMALFIALHVVFVRFIVIDLTFVRYDFGFLPISMASIIFGPIYGGLVGALADLTGLAIKGQLGSWFPGFTINAALYGISYGLFLHKKKITWKRVIICVVSSIVVMGLVLTPVWLYYFYKFVLQTDKAFYFLFVNQIVKCLVMIPVQIVTIKLVTKYLEPQIKRLAK